MDDVDDDAVRCAVAMVPAKSSNKIGKTNTHKKNKLEKKSSTKLSPFIIYLGSNRMPFLVFGCAAV